MERPARQLTRTTGAAAAEGASPPLTSRPVAARRFGLHTLRALPWRDFGAVVGMVAGWRAATWLFALLASGSVAGIYPPPTLADFLNRTLLQQEALWHIWIAQAGYDPTPHGPNSAAFPPLFPLLIRLTYVIIPSWTIAAAIVAHAAIIGACAYLVALARLDADRDTSLRTVAAALLWPAAPFLGAVYPEAILLLTVAAALYHARRGQWRRAGLWAALAGLTRGVGLLVVVPLAVEWWVQRGERAGVTAGQRLAGLAAIAAAPLGFLGFLAALGVWTDSPGAYFRAQDALDPGSLRQPIGLQTLLDLPAILTNAAPAIRGYPVESRAFRAPYIPAAIDAGALLVAGGAGLWFLLRGQRSYGLFALAGVVAVFLIDGLPGAGRHLLLLAPLFLALGDWTRRPLAGSLAATLGVALVALTLLLYVNGFWVG